MSWFTGRASATRRSAAIVAIALGVGTAVVPSVATAAPATTSIVATDDAYVIATSPTKNYGTDQKLKIDASPITRSYVKFDLSGVTGTITTVTLQLVPAANANVGFDVRTVASNAWSESSITWNNAPAVGASVGHSPATLRSKVPVTLDVTNSIVAGIRSFAITDLGSSTTLQLNSSEQKTASLRPTLVVTTQSAPPPLGPCGQTTTPTPVKHVIWIFMENHGYNQVVGAAAAPYENQLIAQCGIATNFHAETHPSLPNYIAATSGNTQGVTDDAAPASHPLAVASIFSQVKGVGKTWRSYQESAPANCSLTSSGQYAVKHDPAAYYTGIRTDCASWDVPLGTTSAGNFVNDLNNNTLPAFAFVTPNLCNDTHDCSVATGDLWLKNWFAKIVASPGYADGSTVIFLTWDEDEGAESNRIPTMVVSPSTPVGTVSATSFSHYSMLKTAEELLGIGTFLGHAGDAGTASMRAAFNL